MVLMGTMHFVFPAPFQRAMPDYLPNPSELVAISGFFEIAGGIGLLIPRLRSFASWGLVALFVAVFPANVNMALHPDTDASAVVRALLWLRLPLQIPLIAWARWVGR